VVVAALATFCGTGLIGPALAATVDPTTVPLGTHRFGHLAHPDAIVATVGADGVGWDNPPEGSANGPWSFDVAADGSVFLLDQNNDRLLAWDPGQPDAPARAVPLPRDEIRVAADLAIGNDGTIYLSYLPTNPPDNRKTLMVCALTPAGKLLWTAPTDIAYLNARLRTVPDGSVYWEGTYDAKHPPNGWWTPVTSPEGAPLSLARQRAGATQYQPMPGGLRFEEAEVGEGSAHHWNLTLTDRNDRVVGDWRVTSDDDLGGTIDEPGMVEGHPVVVLEVARQTQDDFLYEYVAVRLPGDGETVKQLSLDPRAVWGDVPVTGLRVGPNGSLYQLRSDIDTGVTVARYALAAPATPPPSSTPPSSPTPTVTRPTVTPPTATTPTVASPDGTEPASPTVSSSKTGWIVGGSLVALSVVGLVIWLWYWRRNSTEPGS
jgi:hypothetical protein